MSARFLPARLEAAYLLNEGLQKNWGNILAVLWQLHVGGQSINQWRQESGMSTSQRHIIFPLLQQYW